MDHETALACEQGLEPLAILLSAGQAGDSPHLPLALDATAVPRRGPGRARQRPERVLADKAYSSRANRAWLRRHGIAATIPSPGRPIASPPQPGQGRSRPPACDPVIYRDRNAVERGIDQLEQHRAVTTCP
ncbi:transposase [Nocardia jiangsuensis]|uniref:Transposase n=1 Tax=Nocardia jiangsuensis TaxID=1691563 RepID=A0ABV8DYJ2_9NOCA